MLPLFFWAFAGIAVHFLLALVNSVINSVKFNFKAQGIICGLYIVIAAIVAYFGSTANLAGWFLKAIFCAGGFLLPFLTAKLTIISKQV